MNKLIIILLLLWINPLIAQKKTIHFYNPRIWFIDSLVSDNYQGSPFGVNKLYYLLITYDSCSDLNLLECKNQVILECLDEKLMREIIIKKNYKLFNIIRDNRKLYNEIYKLPTIEGNCNFFSILKPTIPLTIIGVE